MCRTFSFIASKNGELYYSLRSDSHEDIVADNEIIDNHQVNIVRIEFTPGNWQDVESYQLKVDESLLPPWWDRELQESIYKKCCSWVSQRIVTGTRKQLIGVGPWVLVNANINSVLYCRIAHMEHSEVHDVGLSSIDDAYDCKIDVAANSALWDIMDCDIGAIVKSKVYRLTGTKVKFVDDSHVEECNNSVINTASAQSYFGRANRTIFRMLYGIIDNADECDIVKSKSAAVHGRWRSKVSRA
jgi:hypothetical protein